MKLIPIIADRWKMDGGVSFGVVPKSLWNRNKMADDNNMIPIVNRCLLIQAEDRLILIDTGLGDKRDDKYYQVRYLEPEVSLLKSLKEAGFRPEDITDIIFTHLHDDHVGGATFRDDSGSSVPLFPAASFICSRAQWEWAWNPNKREGAAFFRDNLIPLEQSGRLRLIDSPTELCPGLRLELFNGHTRGQIIPYISYKDRTIIYMADFIPTAFNIPMPYIPSVDIEPLVTLQEKEVFLKEAATNNYILFFEHDHYTECCTVIETEKGFRMDSTLPLSTVTG